MRVNKTIVSVHSLSAALFMTCWAVSGVSAQRGEVPEGMLLGITVPVSDNPDGDNIGAPLARLAELYARTNANLTGLRYDWSECEPNDPADGPSKYVWPERSDPFLKIRNLQKMVSFGVDPPDWGKDLKKQDKERYWELLERFVTAATREARTKHGARYFHVPGNETSLLMFGDPPIYKPEYPDWYHYYMDTALHVSKAIKRDSQDNQVVIGALVVGDAAHVGALYAAGAKDNYDVMDIHAYGDERQHVSMKQILETHETMAGFGDGDKKIWLGEGWSCFPLPKHLDGNLDKNVKYTSEDAEHYWETIQIGWMNLTKPRRGEYDPGWVLGAKYFTFCDLIEGRGWRKRAVPQRNDKGEITHYLVDGYRKSESELGPFFRPWGLVDINGEPKGDLVDTFPPYIPEHRFMARLAPRQPRGGDGRSFLLTLTFRNMDTQVMTDVKFSVYGRSQAGRGKAFDVQTAFAGSDPPDRIDSRGAAAVECNVVLPEDIQDRGDDHRIRLYGEMRCRYAGKPYYLDAWGPTIAVK